ncbi:hypothetical protein EAI35_23020 [Enterobacter bugandensis]|nr:hypothetical protein EAI35_23020 [Enterobacter bugandensis]
MLSGIVLLFDFGRRDTLMDDFLKDFGKVVEGSSGALSFGLIQCLVMAGAVTSLSRQTGVQYWLMLAAALVATVGFFLCIFSVARVIKEVSSTNKVRRLQLSILLYPAAIGALLSAKVSLISLLGK